VGWQENYDPVTGYYDGEDVTAITFPVQLNYIFGKEGSAHTFEVGGGITYVSKKMEIMNFYDDRETQLFGTFCFMYRRQPINGGFSWRIGFTPLVEKDISRHLPAQVLGIIFKISCILNKSAGIVLIKFCCKFPLNLSKCPDCSDLD
jgi:hypothetical protein